MFYCRRDDAKAFRNAFSAGAAAPLSAPAMDAVLHGERLGERRKRLHQIVGDWRDLPDGAMVANGTQSYLVRSSEARPWSSAGYGPPENRLDGEVFLITPPSTVRAFRAGYAPVLHPTASR